MAANKRDRSVSLLSDEKEPIGYPIQINTLTKDTSATLDVEGNEITEDIDIDRRLLPMLGALYSIALIDRTNLSAARVAGAGIELKLTAGAN
uniref:Phthalate transporter n=1 Tax=Melanopsichium pennsylvanicum 4 TaxID=1398559 RepID=A0A077R8N1_9BASI|nr:phthalate transporter [Melanopsichium pennsylvanicum 4]